MANQQRSPDYWGIDNDYGVLRDVLLGKPDYFKWVEAGPLIGRTLKNIHKTGIEFDMSMFKLGGGGVHCLCQALKRDPVQV